MTDETTWIIQAQQGDDEAFTNLVETYQKPVYNLCYRMLGEPEAAEDAAQETFLKVYQNLARYDRERSFATWLLSIAAHHCIDKLRRRRFNSFSIDEDEEGQTDLPDRSAPDPESETSKRQERERLHNCLQSLDPTDRAAVIMRYWQDCSEVEIAQALKLTVPAVKSRLHRARRALADLWEEEPAHVRTERKPYGSPAF
ncbi:MAG: sigma-70 family RNA polymerase sigma factor [Candidatus Atribacteria bacterium]|nr:sigma-70 family RNA polymerase sigma factor [Candidatus Atribacteria bacterium]